MKSWFRLCLLLLLTAGAKGEILEVCPNPYGDEGAEYIKVNCSGLECKLDDGEGFLHFKGNITLAKNSEIFYNTFGYEPDAEFTPKFALSNSGEVIYLYEDGKIVDFFDYSNEGLNFRDDGLIYFRNSNKGDWDFKYQDWSHIPPIKTNVTGRIMVSPFPYEFEAENEILLASYTFTDYNLLKFGGNRSGNLDKEGKEKAGEKEKEIIKELFLDATPVGGIPFEEVKATEHLNVHFLKSNSYKNFHYKFGVVDNKRVIITTENWKWEKRGYIIEFESEIVAKYLKDVLKSDIQFEGEAGNPKEIEGHKIQEYGGKIFNFGRYAKQIENDTNSIETDNNSKSTTSTNTGTHIEVFILPDYNPVFDILSSAEHRLLIQVPYMDFQWFGKDAPLLDSIIIAAENGAMVRILLDRQYNQEKNQRTVEFINELAKNKGLDVEARIMDFPLHGKMVVSDNISLITSANFNRYGLKLNRECGIIFHDEEVSSFLEDQFIEDWGPDDGESRWELDNSNSEKNSDSSINPYQSNNLLNIIGSIVILSISLAITCFALSKK